MYKIDVSVMKGSSAFVTVQIWETLERRRSKSAATMTVPAQLL